ncbi:TPA: hypothetical protein ACXP8A_005122 [Klebsiella pneumoniae]
MQDTINSLENLKVMTSLILSREVAATLSVDYQFTPINEQCQDLLVSVLTSGDKKFAVMQHPINSTLAIIYRFV